MTKKWFAGFIPKNEDGSWPKDNFQVGEWWHQGAQSRFDRFLSQGISKETIMSLEIDECQKLWFKNHDNS